MFISRLDNARNDVDKEAKKVKPLASQSPIPSRISTSPSATRERHRTSSEGKLSSRDSSDDIRFGFNEVLTPRKPSKSDPKYKLSSSPSTQMYRIAESKSTSTKSIHHSMQELNLNECRAPPNTVAKIASQNTPNPSTNKKKRSRILHELNEYLFDLFDANCMEDFKRIDQFEKSAIKVFEEDEGKVGLSTGFTHAQYAKHQEFLSLFEELIESFLISYQYTPDTLYAEIEQYLNERKQSEQQKSQTHSKPNEDGSLPSSRSPYFDRYLQTDNQCHSSSYTNLLEAADLNNVNDSDDDDRGRDEDENGNNALEIIEVIAFYTDFEKWCNMMKENLQIKRHYLSFQQKLELATSDMKDNSTMNSDFFHDNQNNKKQKEQDSDDGEFRLYRK